MENRKIEELSLPELKAAYDFIRENKLELENRAHEEGIKPDMIPAYNEVKSIEDKLYHRLLNSIRNLE